MSMREIAAMMTTAASAVCGRSANRDGTSTSMRITRPAPTRPVTWVLARELSATAVREALTEIAKPWKNPAAALAAPTAIISWFASTSSPRFAAKLDEVAMVSVSETSTMPTAAAASRVRSLALVHGNEGTGSPCGSVPTVFTPSAARSNTAETMVAATTPTSTAGIFFEIRGSPSSSTRVPRPTSSVVVLVWSRPEKNALTSWTKVSASVEKPKSLGSWPTKMVMARPFM